MIRQWEAERPDIDPMPVRIYGLIAQIQLQSTALIDAVLAPLGLVRGTFDVLSALRRAGAPFSLTPKHLAASLLLSGAGLSSRLDRLEAMKLIARRPEPADRRTVRITLTPRGAKLVDEAIPRVFAAQWRCLEPLGEAGRHGLAEALAHLAAAIAASAETDTAEADTAEAALDTLPDAT